MKRIPARCVVFLLVLGGSVQAAPVTLRNGDRLSGDIVRADTRTLTVDTQRMGTVALDEGEVRVRPVAAPPVVLPRYSVRTIRSEHEEAYRTEVERYDDPGLLELWGGYVDTGFSLASGNSDTLTFATGRNATRRTPRDTTSVSIQCSIPTRAPAASPKPPPAPSAAADVTRSS